MRYLNIPKKLLLGIVFLSMATFANAQDVYIPDANFKAALVNNTAINTNGDSEIQVLEAQAYSGLIDVSDQSISSLIGIEAFTALTELDCNLNQLTSLDMGNNTALTYLFCGNNQLESLNVRNNTALTQLICGFNQLTSLDVSNNIALYYLGCGSNQLTSLDVSKNTALYHLDCYWNQLTSLDVSKNTALDHLDCSGNSLTSLDLSNNTALAYLYCTYNQLTSLDVSQNTALTCLYCYYNQLMSLDVSKNTALTALYCYGNPLTSLNIQNGHNTNFYITDFTNNPDLSCIQVDDTTYANAHFTNKDSWAHYSTDCSGTVTSINSKLRVAPKIYPNPATSLLTIDTDEGILSKEVIGLDGLVIQEENSSKNTLDISNIPTGLYFIRLKTQEGVYEQKFVKE